MERFFRGKMVRIPPEGVCCGVAERAGAFPRAFFRLRRRQRNPFILNFAPLSDSVKSGISGAEAKDNQEHRHDQGAPHHRELLLHHRGELSAVFRVLSPDAGLPLLPDGGFQYRERYDGNRPLVLYARRTDHPSVLRLSVGYFRPQTSLHLRLFRLYGCLRRLYRGRYARAVHRAARGARTGVRYGDRLGQYAGDRHHPLLPSRRSAGILRVGQQHRHVDRSHGGALHARCRAGVQRPFRGFGRFVFARPRLRPACQDTRKAPGETGADFARPFLFGQGHSCRARPAAAIHSLRHDHHLCGHVRAADRHRGR